MKEKLLSKDTAAYGAAGCFLIYFAYRVLEILYSLIFKNYGLPSFDSMLFVFLTLATAALFVLIRKEHIAFGGVFGLMTLLHVYWFFDNLISFFKYSSFISFLSFASSGIEVLAIVIITAFAVMTVIQPDFFALKFWFIPAVLMLITYIISMFMYIIFFAQGYYSISGLIPAVLGTTIKSLLLILGIACAGRVFSK